MLFHVSHGIFQCHFGGVREDIRDMERDASQDVVQEKANEQTKTKVSYIFVCVYIP